MAARVVDELETVEVEDRDRAFALAALDLAEAGARAVP
jgi:hypothetical protein